DGIRDFHVTGVQTCALPIFSQAEKIVFPLVLCVLVGMLLPDAAPLIGMFAFGNLLRECGVVDRLADTTRNALINIVTIALGLTEIGRASCRERVYRSVSARP